MKSRKPLVIAIALFLGTFALYARSIGYGFIEFDDPGVLLRQDALFGQTSLVAALRAIFIEQLPREEPLLARDISWAIDGLVFGFKNPVGYHLGNVALNAINATLLFLVLLASTERLRFSAAVAVLFAILPLHVEPVAWAMGRKDLLCAFFILAALLAEARAERASTKTRAYALSAIALICVPLAIFSKVSGVAIVPILFLARVFRPYLDGRKKPDEAFGGLRSIAKSAVRYLPHALLTALCATWYGRTLAAFGVLNRGPGMSLEYLGILARFLPLVFGKYFELFVLPFDMSISYEWPLIGVELSAVELARAMLFYPVAVLVTVYLARARRDLLFYWLGFFTLMLPYLQLRYIGIWIAVRYVYLSSFCVLAIGVDVVERAIASGVRARRMAGLTFAVMIPAIYLIQASLHLTVFESDLRLWEYEASRERPSMLAFAQLSSAYVARGELEPAAEAVAHGIERYESLHLQRTGYDVDPPAYYARLFYWRGQIGRVKKAPVEAWMADWMRARELSPRDPLYPLSISEYEREQGHGKEALHWFGRFADLTYGDPLANRENIAELADEWTQKFPELCPEIRALMERLEQGSSSRARCKVEE